MARSSDPKKEGEEREEEEEIWGTWEELLLACAVNRHGTHSWDSVAGELRSRVSSSSAVHALTADLCRHRYRHLHRRFSDAPPDHDDDPAAQIPWLDRLRSLRVAELRQQLHRSDVSIGSLQLKVKRLKEERERSLKPPDKDGKDSCKESNSTEPKPEERVREPDPGAAPGSGTGRVVGGGGGETSYNGSSDTIAKGADPSPATDQNPVNESGESVAESKGGEPDGNKESSDVQSSASLTRRRQGGRLRKAVASDSGDAGGGAADVPAEEESQPLISVLQMLRSSEYGPIFDRRLESQESESYGRMIRRHVDFEIIQRRIERKGYSSAEFFRDLLLLCNNAIFFFPTSSHESIAAVHLRELVNKEISTVLRKSSDPFPSSAAKEATPPPAQQHPPLPLRPSADRSNTSPHDKKPKPKPAPAPAPTPTPTPATTLPLLVVCRKRSSIAGKPPKKVDKEEVLEKPEPEIVEEVKEKEKEEEVFDKKSTKQRSTVARGLRTNKTRDSSSSGGGSKLVVVKSPGNVPQPSPPAKEDAEPEPDPKPAASAAKKRSAANFLNRMKRSSPLSSNGLLLDMLKNSSSTAATPANAGKRGGDQKKKSQEDGRKEKEKEKEKASNAVKRSVGRPPKRTATAPPSKRRREEAKNATPPPSSSKKRARR